MPPDIKVPTRFPFVIGTKRWDGYRLLWHIVISADLVAVEMTVRVLIEKICGHAVSVGCLDP